MAILSGNVFNVKDLSPALWLDAADSNTLYDAVSGGALVAAGGAVARWEDKSGNGRHATQSILANRPLRTVGAQNTRDVLRFDGTNDTMTCPVLPTSATDFSVVIVGRHAAKTWTGNLNTELQAYIEMPHLTTRGWVLQTRPDQGANRFQFCAFPTSGSIGIIRDVLPNQYNVLVGTRIQNGADSFSVNGVNQTNSNTTAWVFQNSPLNIGSWNGQRFLQGDILEIMIFSYVLSTAQRQSIERYLANKWGLGFNPLSLSPALWLDASDSNTLYDATTSGALVGAGGAVARWEDKSGNARHVTQATLSSRPIKVEGVQGGKSVVRFDGVNDLLSTAANSPSVTGVTIYFVSKHNSFGGSNFARLLEMGSNGYIYMVNLSNAFSSQSYRGLYIAGSLLKDSASFSATTGVWRVHGISNANNSLVSQTVHRVNGAVSSGVITGDGTLTIPANVAIHIGNRSALDRAFDGDIAEILVFPTVLTNEQNIVVERYLAQKWNIIP